MKKRIVVIARGSGLSCNYSASNTKAYYSAKILNESGLMTLVLSGLVRSSYSNCHKVGRHDGVIYCNLSVVAHDRGVLRGVVDKITHLIRVLMLLIKLKKKYSRVIYVYDDESVPLLVLLLCGWVKIIELVYDIEEWPISHQVPFFAKLRSHVFALASIFFVDKVVCVSYGLREKVRQYSPASKVYVLPALASFCGDGFMDFDRKEFLYCGSVGYADVIDMIFCAYLSVRPGLVENGIGLGFVLYGDEKKINDYRQRFSVFAPEVRVLVGLSKEQYRQVLGGSFCLIAPLRDTLQDELRFPQKLAEYAASKRPVITSPVGDVARYYGRRLDPIFFLEKFSSELLGEKMRFLSLNKDIAESAGEIHYDIGLEFFDYSIYRRSFADFILM